jgi:hypothetical protein
VPRRHLALCICASGALAATTLDVAGETGAAPLPLGRVIDSASPPPGAGAWETACSAVHPLCVHAAPGTSPRFSALALSAADRSWETLTAALAVPPPDGSPEGSWPVYLVDGVEGGGYALLDAADPRTHFDRASSFALVDRETPSGCALDLAVARAVARGSLWRAAPATDEGTARAQSEMLARLATACAPPDDEVAVFQSQPELTTIDPSSPAYDRGASLFFDWVDMTFGARPGALVVGLWALAPTRTPPGAPRWAGAPTGFDVLRVSLRNALWQGSTLDDIFVRFAVARASMRPPARPAWHVPWPAQARRLASPEPVAPTGAAYVVVDHAGARQGAKLRIEAQWEDYGRMRWVAVKLDAAGRSLAEIPVRSLDRGTRASMTVEPLDGVDRVLIVGVNVGSTDHPFDPAQGEWEPHGWLLTVQGE